MARKSFSIKWFGRRKRLEDLDLEQLNRERLRLKREEQKFVARIEQHEREKATLFGQAVGLGSTRQKTMIARRIKELDTAAKHDESLARAVSTQIRILGGIIKLKEDRGFRERYQMLGLLKNMDVSELAGYIENIAVEGDLTDEKLGQLLRTLEEGDSMSVCREDADVLEIVAAMEEAETAADDGNEAAATHGLNRVNQILSRGEEEIATEAHELA